MAGGNAAWTVWQSFLGGCFCQNGDEFSSEIGEEDGLFSSAASLWSGDALSLKRGILRRSEVARRGKPKPDPDPIVEIKVAAFHCKDLPSTFRKVKPFLRVTAGDVVAETKVCRGTTKPFWRGEVCTLAVKTNRSGTMGMPTTVKVECWHHKKTGQHHLLGSVTVAVPPLVHDDEEKGEKSWHPMLGQKQKKAGSVELRVVSLFVSGEEVLSRRNTLANEGGRFDSVTSLLASVDVSREITREKVVSAREKSNVRFSETVEVRYAGSAVRTSQSFTGR
jgi:hypothetical protein